MKPLTFRADSRRSVRLCWRYRAEEMTGEGHVWDLSRTGWRASTPFPLEVGLILAVSLLLPTDSEWLEVDEAVVRWADGPHCGVEIVTINESRLARLDAFLERLAEHGREV